MVFNLFTRTRPATERFTMAQAGRVIAVVIKRRGNAKRLTMRVRDGEIHLTTPPGIDQGDASAFISKHIDWVHEQLRKDDAAMAAADDITGPSIWFHGVVTKVQLVRSPHYTGRSRVDHDDGTITIHMAADSRVRPVVVLEDWLKKQARVAIKSSLDEVLPGLNEAPVPISVRDQKTRWGSCSTTRRLSFNWRLIMAPPACLHYVVVHEAVHLLHHDHSSRVWGKVEEVMPDFSIQQNWLKTHQQALFANIERRLAGLKPVSSPAAPVS
ncbi:MAG: M48 family metallopeptidase [Alphaproteobacteria bacterium]|nr:M48 family metallopeptidase [Alphaproteobacteria bacterium]